MVLINEKYMINLNNNNKKTSKYKSKFFIARRYFMCLLDTLGDFLLITYLFRIKH